LALPTEGLRSLGWFGSFPRYLDWRWREDLSARRLVTVEAELRESLETIT